MKKSIIKILFFVLLTTLSVACLKVTTVSLNKTELFLKVGETDRLLATLKPKGSNEILRWESSNSEVVTVKEGYKISFDYQDNEVLLTAKSVGTAIITATTEDGKSSAKCTVVVTLQPIEPDMVFVEGGDFWMGSDYYNFEQPIHKVTVSSFNIAKFQVTQKEWKAIMGVLPSNCFYKGDNLPIYNVSWNDAKDYISQLNNATGKNYRLLTEAEWEYAARGGKKSSGTEYSGSNNIDLVAWYSQNSDEPNPVGKKAANELGIYDMSGNVWEFCSDWYGYYSNTPQTDPQGPISGTHKIIRGGDFNSFYSYCRVAMRMRKAPDENLNYYCGFRLVHP